MQSILPFSILPTHTFATRPISRVSVQSVCINSKCYHYLNGNLTCKINRKWGDLLETLPQLPTKDSIAPCRRNPTSCICTCKLDFFFHSLLVIRKCLCICNLNSRNAQQLDMVLTTAFRVISQNYGKYVITTILSFTMMSVQRYF